MITISMNKFNDFIGNKCNHKEVADKHDDFFLSVYNKYHYFNVSS